MPERTVFDRPANICLRKENLEAADALTVPPGAKGSP